MAPKSERLKKLESEFLDLEQWKKLGLVPKSDLVKHEEEIKLIKEKLKEEKERIRFMKESGDVEEYIAPKKSASKQVYQEPQTLPDMDASDNSTEGGIDVEAETFDFETASGEGKAGDVTIYDDDDDPFSDKNRWKRGVLEDPDVDKW